MQNNENTNTPDLPEFILPVRLRALTHPSALAGKVDEKATQLHAIASLKVLLDATKPQNGAATSSAANHVSAAAAKQETMLAPSSIADMPNGVANALTDVNLEAVGETEEEPPEAMDMGWPSGARKRITYILLAPIVFPLWLTLPDTRSPRARARGVRVSLPGACAAPGLRNSRLFPSSSFSRFASSIARPLPKCQRVCFKAFYLNPRVLLSAHLLKQRLSSTPGADLLASTPPLRT
ncbi:hypothetical protein Zmor_020403 [Zophobas morio]|uniref:Uncharacterized protein n=1 Tax=Zophobas morio TaxID=2755281 RepID=A0AA38I335_9CUCU|nr:hypothetical protein Zmor_020403 [Zophobas morio]